MLSFLESWNTMLSFFLQQKWKKASYSKIPRIFMFFLYTLNSSAANEFANAWQVTILAISFWAALVALAMLELRRAIAASFSNREVAASLFLVTPSCTYSFLLLSPPMPLLFGSFQWPFLQIYRLSVTAQLPLLRCLDTSFCTLASNVATFWFISSSWIFSLETYSGSLWLTFPVFHMHFDYRQLN